MNFPYPADEIDATPLAHRQPTEPDVWNPTFYHVLLAGTQQLIEVGAQTIAQIVTQPVTINSNRPQPRTYADMEAIVREASTHFDIPVDALVYVATTELWGEPYVDHTAPAAPKSRLYLPENDNVIILPGDPGTPGERS